MMKCSNNVTTSFSTTASQLHKLYVHNYTMIRDQGSSSLKKKKKKKEPTARKRLEKHASSKDQQWGSHQRFVYKLPTRHDEET